MKTRMMVLLLSVFVGCAAVGVAQEAQAPKPPFAITISAALASVKVGERIPLLVTMTNISGRDISLEGGQRISELGNEVERDMGVMVYDADGKRVRETEYGRLVYGRRYKMFPGKTVCCAQWKPGESFMEEADLTKEFDLSKPGTYTVEARRSDEGIMGFVVSNRISFTIVATAQAAQTPKASFSISIATPATSIPAGSPIPLTATMKNTSNHDVPIRRESNSELANVVKAVPRRLIIRVLDGRGRLVQETEYGRNIHVGEESSAYVRGFVSAVLKPGETYKEEADLSKEFDLTTPGTYTVEVQKRDPDTGKKVRSNKITFTVTQ